MKKFIMVTPQQQPGKLQLKVYEPQGNSLLEYGETHFPIIPTINGYVDDGEEIKLITLTYDTENCAHNLEILKQELEDLKADRGIVCELDSILVPADESVSATLHVFQEFIDRVDDDDELFACITYGSKPMPIVEVMALQYAYRIKRNASIECVVYGSIDFNAPAPYPSKIYDVTSLVKLDEIVRLLAERGIEDPETVIASILA